MSPRARGTGQGKAESTRRDLVHAAKSVLRTEGFSSATARNIAARAGCNQGLVFYHFGSVGGLLIAALDEVSRERRERFQEDLANVTTPTELVKLATKIFTEDLETGDAALLIELIVGSSAIPGLGPMVRERMDPWVGFASSAVEPFLMQTPLADLVSATDLGTAIVAFYLGMEVISHLDGSRDSALRIFQLAERLSVAAGAVLFGSASASTSTVAAASPAGRSSTKTGKAGQKGEQ